MPLYLLEFQRNYIGKNEKKLIYCLEALGYQFDSRGDSLRSFKNAKNQYMSYHVSDIGEVISIYDIYGQAVDLNLPKEQKYTNSLLYKYLIKIGRITPSYCFDYQLPLTNPVVG